MLVGSRIGGVSGVDRLPFFVTYEMFTGSSGRGVDTALEAIDLYRQLKLAGGGSITVTDETGKVFSLTDLLLLAGPTRPHTPKDRAGA